MKCLLFVSKVFNLKAFLLSLHLFVLLGANAQESISNDSLIKVEVIDTIQIYDEYEVDQKPVFMDDLTNVQFFQFISSRLLYPEECQKNKKQGVVKVEFVVMENGSVDRVKIVSGIDCISIDKEIERVIMLSPIWTPGKKDGINVNVKLNIPIKFKLH